MNESLNESSVLVNAASDQSIGKSINQLIN